MKMKMKIQALYLTGTVLLIGAAGVGDSITFDAVGSWTGAAILTVLMCAARGFVGVARNLLGPMATNPQFAEEISRGIKEMLLDTEDLKVTRGVEGKEAKFMAALYGMNAGGEK